MLKLLLRLIRPTQDQTPRQQKDAQWPHNIHSELIKYKSMYDSGTITEEEYEAKKAQLLML